MAVVPPEYLGTAPRAIANPYDVFFKTVHGDNFRSAPTAIDTGARSRSARA
jgi:hypothetical protein